MAWRQREKEIELEIAREAKLRKEREEAEKRRYVTLMSIDLMVRVSDQSSALVRVNCGDMIRLNKLQAERVIGAAGSDGDGGASGTSEDESGDSDGDSEESDDGPDEDDEDHKVGVDQRWNLASGSHLHTWTHRSCIYRQAQLTLRYPLIRNTRAPKFDAKGWN